MRIRWSLIQSQSKEHLTMMSVMIIFLSTGPLNASQLLHLLLNGRDRSAPIPERKPDVLD